MTEDLAIASPTYHKFGAVDTWNHLAPSLDGGASESSAVVQTKEGPESHDYYLVIRVGGLYGRQNQTVILVYQTGHDRKVRGSGRRLCKHDVSEESFDERDRKSCLRL